jgi:hypothetical protein
MRRPELIRLLLNDPFFELIPPAEQAQRALRAAGLLLQNLNNLLILILLLDIY